MAEAQFELSVIYSRGQGVMQDNAEALKWLTAAAEQKFPPAQFFLAYNYSKGSGLPQDDVKAFTWFRAAAENGLANAQRIVGGFYLQGKGTARDPAEALKWFQKAAKSGDAGAESNLGYMYATGSGVAQNDAKAAELVSQGRRRRRGARARPRSRPLLRNGRGVAKDKAEAIKLVPKAALARAIRRAGATRPAAAAAKERPRTAAEAATWIFQPRGKGDTAAVAMAGATRPTAASAAAQARLADLYARGKGVTADNAKALTLFQKRRRPATFRATATRFAAMRKATASSRIMCGPICGPIWPRPAAIRMRRGLRATFAKSMTPEQIDEAQRLAREWTPKHR